MFACMCIRCVCGGGWAHSGQGPSAPVTCVTCLDVWWQHVLPSEGFDFETIGDPACSLASKLCSLEMYMLLFSKKCVYVYVIAPCVRRSQGEWEGFGVPGTGATGGWEPPRGCWAFESSARAASALHIQATAPSLHAFLSKYCFVLNT